MFRNRFCYMLETFCAWLCVATLILTLSLKAFWCTYFKLNCIWNKFYVENWKKSIYLILNMNCHNSMLTLYLVIRTKDKQYFILLVWSSHFRKVSNQYTVSPLLFKFQVFSAFTKNIHWWIHRCHYYIRKFKNNWENSSK